ncbi:HAD superfamily hydrolase [Spiroplasma helicoides]|uniref:HAD superfamily hydrolase n=1 Tax=Spiroplasma helicoides TaxID=216938 RepID=A0A1B3SKY1_9MOLU|nr:HAD-IIB family hydrolase [Spiroplasma helicoides]AOG60598.1 HAD superfamily hydrolase [Spiroplasma helicoides]
MKLKNIKVIITDLDGTLLFNNKYASEEQNEYLINLQKKGIKLMIATGRNWLQTIDVAKTLKIDKFFNKVLCDNGVYLSDVSSFNPILIDFVDSNVVKEIFDKLTKDKIAVFLKNFYNENIFLTNSFGLEHKFFSRENELIKNNELKFFENVSFMFSHFPIDSKLNIFFKKLKDIYQENISVIWDCDDEKTQIHYVVSNISANKGIKSFKFLESLGYKNEEIIFFGDSGNDIPALKLYKNSVAMGNSLQEVKDAAKYITDNCLDNGIMNFLKKYLD